MLKNWLVLSVLLWLLFFCRKKHFSLMLTPHKEEGVIKSCFVLFLNYTNNGVSGGGVGVGYVGGCFTFEECFHRWCVDIAKCRREVFPPLQSPEVL